jgi:hypothetical protein
MKHNEFETLVESTLSNCKTTLTSKREEYVLNPDTDVLGNFKNNAELSIVGTPEGVAWELMTKHLQSIKDYCSGELHSPLRDTDAFSDISINVVYLRQLKSIF